MKPQDVVAWLRAVATSVAQEQDLLDQLDGGAGDGDHGTTLVLGMRRVLTTVESDTSSVSAVLRTAGRSFAGVGGSIGPLWGMALLRAAQTLDTAGTTDAAALAEALVAAGTAMADIGSASVGDRTLLDAFVPAAEAFRRAVAQGMGIDGAAHAGLDAATAGALHTAEMPARRGRASRNARLAAGQVDPGAASIALCWLVTVDPTSIPVWRAKVGRRRDAVECR